MSHTMRDFLIILLEIFIYAMLALCIYAAYDMDAATDLVIRLFHPYH